MTSTRLIIQPFVILGSKTLVNLDSTEKDCFVLEIVNNQKPFCFSNSIWFACLNAFYWKMEMENIDRIILRIS